MEQVVAAEQHRHAWRAAPVFLAADSLPAAWDVHWPPFPTLRFFHAMPALHSQLAASSFSACAPGLDTMLSLP